MGRKSKLKKLKKQANLEPPKKDLDKQEFVKEMQHKGYAFKELKRSPEVPTKRIEPEV